MHADSSAARLGWPGRRAKASAGRRTVFPKCGAAFQGAFEGGRTKIKRGRTRIEGGAQASKGGAAPRYVALANSLNTACSNCEMRFKFHLRGKQVMNFHKMEQKIFCQKSRCGPFRCPWLISVHTRFTWQTIPNDAR